MKDGKKIIGVGLLTAIASSLCCITPVLALISGTSGMASTFSWMEPFRPYLIVFTILVLGFAWYQQLKPNEKISCACEEDDKKSFLKSKLFLGIVTVFAVAMTAFPYYSGMFYSDVIHEQPEESAQNNKTVSFTVSGMTCESCEQHINHTVSQLEGVFHTAASYEKGNVVTSFNPLKVSEAEIKKAINSTGYIIQEP